MGGCRRWSVIVVSVRFLLEEKEAIVKDLNFLLKEIASALVDNPTVSVRLDPTQYLFNKICFAFALFCIGRKRYHILNVVCRHILGYYINHILDYGSIFCALNLSRNPIQKSSEFLISHGVCWNCMIISFYFWESSYSRIHVIIPVIIVLHDV